MKRKLSWIGFISVGIAAVILLRVDRSYSMEAPPEEPEDELKYVCVGDVAVELGEDKRSRYTHELDLELPTRTLQQRCRPPLPQFGETTVSVTSPLRGYAAVFERLPAPPTEALRISEKALVAQGWQETPGSMEYGVMRPDRVAMTFAQEDAWLMTVAVAAPKGEGSFLLMAGEWKSLKRGE